MTRGGLRDESRLLGLGSVLVRIRNLILADCGLRMRVIDSSVGLALILSGVLSSGSLGATLFVNDDAMGSGSGSSWANAYPLLRDALASAAPGDQIWVAEGIYKPDKGAGIIAGVRSESFVIPSNVELYGGFAGFEGSVASRSGSVAATVLSGDLAGDDATAGNAENAYHVVGLALSTVSVTLDGFTIAGGNADSSAGSKDGGGLRMQNGFAEIRGCRFVGNFAESSGGGAACSNGSGASFVDCLFLQNSSKNGAGGLAVAFSRVPVINCRFLSNSGQLGGGLSVFSPGFAGDIVNSEFIGNTAAVEGGGIRVEGSSSDPHVVGCTLVSNTAPSAAGIRLTSAARIASSVLWDNVDVNGKDQGAQLGPFVGPGTVNYSCVQGLASIGGVGNIGGDPKFVSALGPDGIVGTLDDDLRLGATSPCHDAGDNTAFPADEHDLDLDGDLLEAVPLDLSGAPRFVDGPAADVGVGPGSIADMGAREEIAVAGVVTFGSGCPGAGGLAPMLSVASSPVAGAPAGLTLSGATGGAMAALIVGSAQAAIPVGAGGCLLNVQPPFLTVIFIPLGGTGVGNGFATLVGTLPSGTVGAVVRMQGWFEEPLVSQPFSSSKGMEWTIQ